MSDQDIVMDLTMRAQAQGGVGDLWITREEWHRLKIHLRPEAAVHSTHAPQGAMLFGMPIKIKVDYLTEVVKKHAPQET